MHNLNWYYNRLKAMSFEEILFMRGYYFLRDIAEDGRVEIPDALDFELELIDHFQKQKFSDYFPESRERILSYADRIVEGRITIFGCEYDVADNINWNYDYKSQKSWPLLKTIRYVYSKYNIGDPKIVWELNRQQFLPLLGIAYFISGNEIYAQKLIELITTWIHQNPPHYGINWSSGIELALRQISWQWALRYIQDSSYFNEDIKVKIRDSMYLQTDYISKHLSLYSSANNHLISELCAMVTIGIILRKYEWVNKGLKLLTEHVDRQILSDGVGAEQSPSYQANTMEYYILALLVVKRKGYRIPEKVLHLLYKAGLFIQSIIDATGTPPSIGDNDNGAVVKLSVNGYSNYKSILNLVAYLTGKYDLIQDDVEKDEKSFWLLGYRDFEEMIRNKTSRSYKSYNFDSGGYYFLERRLKQGTIKLIFDCGPLGMKPLASHGHADALSFILYIDDIPFFIDPGTFTYHNSYWRNYFRGTSAHNTIRIDGLDQSEFGGPFIALRHAHAECIEFKEGRLIKARHYGYKRLQSPLIHTRTVLLNEERQEIIILDHLEADGRHNVEQFFHIDSECRLLTLSDNSFKITNNSQSLVLTIDNKFETLTYFGDDVLPLGWQSHMYDNKLPTFTIVGRSVISKSEEFITRIVL